jgi:hypothetical protein
MARRLEMTWHTTRPVFFLLSVLAFAALSCNAPSDSTPTPDAATIQRETDDATVRSAAETEAAAAPPEEPTSTPTTEIIHVSFPASPVTLPSYLTDRTSKKFAGMQRTIGDSFASNLFERPFTEGEMEYRAYLDITQANISVEDPWIYFTIYLEGLPPQGTNVFYGAEIDVDVDGRGDYLLTALLPGGAEWTTEGVWVYSDANEDVGGDTPMRADPPDPEADGYETTIFAAGLGDDPDTAWTRIDSGRENVIQLAMKHAVIRIDRDFMWGVWADEGVHEHGWLDYNDHYTPKEAGSPVVVDEFYPLAALHLVDNTCRWVYGFGPSGEEPGLCAAPLPADEPSSKRGYLYCYLSGGAAAASVPVCECRTTCPTEPLQSCPPCMMIK